MMRLEELAAGQRVNGITGAGVEIVATSWIGGDFLEVTYRDAAGAIGEAFLDRTYESNLALETGRDDTFGADAGEWKLGVEALRIKHAALIDPMLAVSNSALQPLPHQITAVYGELLPRTPLRYLLADDPGAGKTIMCGLYIKELLLRGELERCLVVAPGSLADQWQDELWEKFGLKFSVLSRDGLQSAVPGTYFDDNPLLIARMDMLKRDESLQEDLDAIDWDLVVVDEAHRMSAKWGRDGLDRTKRYALGQLLGRRARNFLLMTATPHSGDPEAFQIFLALLDEDRFGGRPTGSSLSPGSDVMRRMLKEDLLTMEGRPLFPPRKAYTVRYRLSSVEQELYDEVGEYVRQGMVSVERIREGDRRRATNLGFALIVLQRRLASSPEAIWRSLQRRRAKLGGLRDELAERGEAFWEQATIRLPGSWSDDPTMEATAEEEAFADEAVERISAAETLGELDAELSQLDRLIPLARRARESGTDQKWLELRSILESAQMTDDSQGRPRKIIVFTEHKDTLNYLRDRITALPGRAEAVVEIHGAMDMRERRRVQHRFTQDPNTTVLLATDAAGEGLNLQAAHLMVNYDLPWNPNRIEQRFGRIHRIGQKETCHLWSLVAEDTREGAVFIRLLEKMEEQAVSLGGKVYDVLGETFEGEPLERLLARAVREGEGARRHLERIIDARVGDELPRLLEQRALYREVLLPVDIEGARRRADLGQRTRLQPHLASAWFAESLHVLGGRMQMRSDGTAEVLRVPEPVRERARAGTVLNERYRNVRFAPEQEQSATAGGTVLGPGSPVFDALVDTVAERYASTPVPGTLLIDPTGRDHSTRLLAAIGHEVVDGRAVPTALSRRFEIVEIDESAAGAAVGLRHLDYRAATDQELTRLRGIQGTALADPVSLAMRWAVNHLVAEHTTDVRNSHGAATERRREAINDRLRNLSPSDPVAGRLRHRLERLAEEAQIVSRRPRIHAVALVVPASMFGITPQIDSVASLEAATARTVRDLEEQGLAATSTEAGVVQVDRGGETVWIDVRVGDGAGHRLRMARSDVIQGANLGDRYRLALIDREEIRYVAAPYDRLRLDKYHQHEFDLVWSSLWRAGSRKLEEKKTQ